MKVLSIKEPYATLIASGIKRIETRSWKTNYRGELFIHASISKIPKTLLQKDFFKNLLKDLDMGYGNIICKCNLVDCIYMDEEFIEKIKENEIEYKCGEYKVGRYAWILEDIELIKPISVKGQLNFWNYNGTYELLNTKRVEN